MRPVLFQQPGPARHFVHLLFALRGVRHIEGAVGRNQRQAVFIEQFADAAGSFSCLDHVPECFKTAVTEAGNIRNRLIGIVAPGGAPVSRFFVAGCRVAGVAAEF